MPQGDVALNLYDFVVRGPGKSTEKYGLRAYDEIILAPMVSPTLDPYLLCPEYCYSAYLNLVSSNLTKSAWGCGPAPLMSPKKSLNISPIMWSGTGTCRP